MKDKIVKFATKYSQIIAYLIVGVLTTLVSWLSCYIAKLFLDSNIALQNNIINAFGWIMSILFAYPTNRKLVFKSQNKNVFKEFVKFVISRLSTLILDLAIMTVCVNLLSLNYWISKICIATVLVLIVNYLLSKNLIFNKKRGDNA